MTRKDDLTPLPKSLDEILGRREAARCFEKSINNTIFPQIHPDTPSIRLNILPLLQDKLKADFPHVQFVEIPNDPNLIVLETLRYTTKWNKTSPQKSSVHALVGDTIKQFLPRVLEIVKEGMKDDPIKGRELGYIRLSWSEQPHTLEMMFACFVYGLGRNIAYASKGYVACDGGVGKVSSFV